MKAASLEQNYKKLEKQCFSIPAASILGHSRMVNEQYYTFDVTDITEKTKIIEMINEETCAM